MFETDDAGSVKHRDYTVVFKLVGFSLYITWLAVLFLSPTLVPYAAYKMEAAASFRLSFIVGLFIGLFVVWKTSKPLVTERRLRIHRALAFSLCPLTLILYGASYLGLPSIWIQLAWFITGCLTVSIISLWNTAFKYIGFEKVPGFFSGALCIGALLFLIVALIQFFGVIMTAALPVLSGVFYNASKSKDIFLERQTERLPKCTAKKMLIKWRTEVGILTYCFCLGFAFSCAIVPGLWPYGTIFLGVAIFAAGMLSYIDSLKTHFLSESFNHKTFFLIVVLGISPLIFVNSKVYLVCCVVLCFFFFTNVVINFSAMAIASEIYDIPPIPYACRGKMANALGMLLGYGAAYFYIGYLDVAVVPTGVQVAIISVIVLFGFVGTFVVTNRYPLLENLSEEDVTSGHVEKVTSNKHGWTARCNKFADQYDFSARQREVLKYLSRGRNASYIATTLFISESTVKNHIYTIYKKSGIHSNQELIDAIEIMEIDE